MEIKDKVAYVGNDYPQFKRGDVLTVNNIIGLLIGFEEVIGQQFLYSNFLALNFRNQNLKTENQDSEIEIPNVKINPYTFETLPVEFRFKLDFAKNEFVYTAKRYGSTVRICWPADAETDAGCTDYQYNTVVRLINAGDWIITKIIKEKA